jgi:hypothetical protein
MDYILDVDSAEREDLNPNDFVYKLNRPLYNVSDFRLISANIPLTQPTINGGSNVLVIDGTPYTLENKFYSSGLDLAYDIEQAVNGSNLTTVTYNSNTMALTFSNVGTSNNFTMELDSYSPFSVLGLDLGNVVSNGGTVAGGVIDLHGPTTLLLRVTSGLDDLKKKVYRHEGQSLYTARILTSTSAGGMMTYKGPDDPVEYYFHEGRFKSIDRLRIRIYYINGSRLVPYDFGNRNLFLKFRVTCSLDKLEPLKDQQSVKPVDLPPPVEIPSLEVSSRVPQFVIVGAILLVGLIVLIFLKPKPRISGPTAP